jgi:hypothetical protein
MDETPLSGQGDHDRHDQNESAERVPEEKTRDYYESFYGRLFAPLEAILGPVDPETIVAIIGFDVGGPLNFCTIGTHRHERFKTYVSCELAVRPEQLPSSIGRYELLVSCDDEQWVRRNLTSVGHLSMHDTLGPGHTIDFGELVDAGESIQAVVLEEVCAVSIDDQDYGILRCIGITRPELEYARQESVSSLLERLVEANVYPHTDIGRDSVL